jgi:Ca2+-transporting ATPase
LRESGQQCAITGSNVNDIASLKSASVSYCLGVNGCQVAKLSSDFVVQDNDFNSIKNSIRWGRNLTVSVRRFIQFSLSGVLPCIVLIALSGGVFGRSPFTMQQILLIDMLTGIGAAVSLATEAPDKLITKSERRKENESILIPCMTRDIIAQVVYQSLVLGIMLFAAPPIFGIKYELYNTPLREGPYSVPTNRMIHQTFLFEVFILMNVFNLFNCRRLSTV